MRKIPVLVAAEVSKSLLELIQHDDRFAVEYRPAANEDALFATLHEHEVLVTRHYNKVTRRVIEHGAPLRLIAQGTSGIDNIDTAAAAERGIAVINTPGENANAVAELVIGQMIALTRTIPAYHSSVARGEWNRADCDSRHELRHFRLGLVGLGRVGTAVAKLAAAFRMRVQAFDPYIGDSVFSDRGAAKCSTLPELISSSDILSLHVPLTDETRGFIGREELASLPRGSFVINAARGEIIDLDALQQLIVEGHVAGAAIDVFAPEPPTTPLLTGDARLILTPHIAGCSHESKASIGRELYREICKHFGFSPLD